jgi:hypothetical protein
MKRRRESRANFMLQVRVLGMSADNRPFNESVQTLNISSRGVVLTGVQSQLKVGEVVGLRYGEKKARYRVAWVRRPDPSQAAEVGLETVEEGKSLWEFDLPAPSVEHYVPPRKYRRYQVDIPVELFVEGSPLPIRATSLDVGLGGCYARTHTPPRAGVGLRIVLWLGQHRLPVQGQVVFSDPGLGVGIVFKTLSEESLQMLQAFLEHPAKGTVARTTETRRR